MGSSLPVGDDGKKERWITIVSELLEALSAWISQRWPSVLISKFPSIPQDRPCFLIGIVQLTEQENSCRRHRRTVKLRMEYCPDLEAQTAAEKVAAVLEALDQELKELDVGQACLRVQEKTIRCDQDTNRLIAEFSLDLREVPVTEDPLMNQMTLEGGINNETE